MIITQAIIRATAAKYTAEQLQGLIDGLLVKLEDGRVVTSASTGNSSYGAQVVATTPDLIELYAAALDYLNGTPRAYGAQAVNINFGFYNG